MSLSNFYNEIEKKREWKIYIESNFKTFNKFLLFWLHVDNESDTFMCACSIFG